MAGFHLSSAGEELLPYPDGAFLNSAQHPGRLQDERDEAWRLITLPPILLVWLLPAESRLTRRLVGSMLRRIAALPSPAG